MSEVDHEEVVNYCEYVADVSISQDDNLLQVESGVEKPEVSFELGSPDIEFEGDIGEFEFVYQSCYFSGRSDPYR